MCKMVAKKGGYCLMVRQARTKVVRSMCEESRVAIESLSLVRLNNAAKSHQ